MEALYEVMPQQQVREVTYQQEYRSRNDLLMLEADGYMAIDPSKDTGIALKTLRVLTTS